MDKEMTLDELKQVTIDYYVNLQRIKKAEEMLNIINYSKQIFFDKKRQWNQMVDRAMANDYSWNASKFRYEGLYKYLMGEC